MSQPSHRVGVWQDLLYSEEPVFYRWNDGLRDYVGRVNAWREVTELREAATALAKAVEDMDHYHCAKCGGEKWDHRHAALKCPGFEHSTWAALARFREVGK